MISAEFDALQPLEATGVPRFSYMAFVILAVVSVWIVDCGVCGVVSVEW
jgi:hypothetical protein